jgi:hypothetical protein
MSFRHELPHSPESDAVIATLEKVHVVNRISRLQREAASLTALLKEEGRNEAAACMETAECAIVDTGEEL